MSNWTALLQSDDYLGVKKQIRNGADLNAKGEGGEPLLSQALRLRCSEELIALLVESGADLLEADDEGVSVFETAVTYDNIAVVKRIIDAGIDVNETRRSSGFTPLMAAICYNRQAIAALLLEHGADGTRRDGRGLNAADYARKTHRKQMLELLGD
jgi:uncharacterized protein